MKNTGIIGLVIAAIIVLGIATVNHYPLTGTHAAPQGQLYQIAYVYDGDTVKLDDGQHVRLIGIDAPEAHDNDKLTRDVNKRHLDRETQLAMGKQAARYARDLLKGRQVRLEFDVEPRDHYGRTLAYLYLADGTFVNEKIIRDGYAYPLTVPPNVRYAHSFQQWFDEAREQKRGLWQ